MSNQRGFGRSSATPLLASCSLAEWTKTVCAVSRAASISFHKARPVVLQGCVTMKAVEDAHPEATNCFLLVNVSWRSTLLRQSSHDNPWHADARMRCQALKSCIRKRCLQISGPFGRPWTNVERELFLGFALSLDVNHCYSFCRLHPVELAGRVSLFV